METTALVTVDAGFDSEALLASFFRGRTANTLAAYRADLGQFADWLQEAPADACRALLAHGSASGHDLVERYLAHLSARYAPSSVKRKLASLKALVKAARERDVVTWTLNVRAPAGRKRRDTAGPGHEVIVRMMELANQGDTPMGRRNLLCIAALYWLGLRRTELLSLDLEHVDLAARRIWVLGKGRSEREPMSIPGNLADLIESYLEVRGTKPGPLIQSMHGNRFDVSDLYIMVVELSTKAGKRTTPHGLRHTAITQACAMTGGDIARVQRFSRHADPRTVMEYVDNLEDAAGDLAAQLSNQ